MVFLAKWLTSSKMRCEIRKKYRKKGGRGGKLQNLEFKYMNYIIKWHKTYLGQISCKDSLDDVVVLTGNKGCETIASAKWIKADSSFLMSLGGEAGVETNTSGFLAMDVVPCFDSGEVTWGKLNAEASPLEVWLGSMWIFETGEVTWGELNIEVSLLELWRSCVWLGSIWIFEIGEVTWGELNAEVSSLDVWSVSVVLGWIWTECKLLWAGGTDWGENLIGTST